MRPLPRPLAPITVATVAAVALTLAAAPSSAATTTLDPAKLPRGADIAIAHLDGTTVVDGTIRVAIDAPTVRLLGKSGTAYVVGTADKLGAKGRVVRVAADGTATPLGRANIYAVALSGDGQSVVSTKARSNRTTKVVVRSATSGAKLAKREFDGYVTVLDAETDRVLVGGAKKTWLWTTSTDSVGTVARLAGYRGDLSADVLAGYDKDPYRGGCSVVIEITTGQQLWRSCNERVDQFNADASRMATIDILSDGIGPSYVAVRAGTGQKLAAYEVKGWFGQLTFETPTALLLETNGRRKAATVRCSDSGCERASATRNTAFPRVAA